MFLYMPEWLGIKNKGSTEAGKGSITHEFSHFLRIPHFVRFIYKGGCLFFFASSSLSSGSFSVSKNVWHGLHW